MKKRNHKKIEGEDRSGHLNGRFNRFSTDKLLDFLKHLERKLTIQISPHLPGEPYQEVAFAHK